MDINCYTCGGTGQVDGETCGTCSGSGQIIVVGDQRISRHYLLDLHARIIDIEDRVNDIMDKCNDIFEKVNE